MSGQAVTAFVDMSAMRPHRHSLENLTGMLSGDLEHKAEQQQPQEFFTTLGACNNFIEC